MWESLALALTFLIRLRFTRGIRGISQLCAVGKIHGCVLESRVKELKEKK